MGTVQYEHYLCYPPARNPTGTTHIGRISDFSSFARCTTTARHARAFSCPQIEHEMTTPTHDTPGITPPQALAGTFSHYPRAYIDAIDIRTGLTVRVPAVEESPADTYAHIGHVFRKL